MEEAFDAYFAQLTPASKRIALALRAAVKRAGPGLSAQLSRGHPSWHGRGWIFSIIGHSAHCNLQLIRGAELADAFPERIEGTGKSLRHVKVRSDDDIDGELEDIIEAAIALDEKGPPAATRGRG